MLDARLEGLQDYARKVFWNLLWQGRETGTYTKQLTDIRQLAASYAVGILRNHPFADGNKRAAFIALSMFLNANGFRLTADPLNAGNTFFDAAAGRLDEEGLVAWISSHSVVFEDC